MPLSGISLLLSVLWVFCLDEWHILTISHLGQMHRVEGTAYICTALRKLLRNEEYGLYLVFFSSFF